VSRELSGLINRVGESASAARINARFVTDLDPGIVSVARIG
jgi:hypothetical protein